MSPKTVVCKRSRQITSCSSLSDSLHERVKVAKLVPHIYESQMWAERSWGIGRAGSEDSLMVRESGFQRWQFKHVEIKSARGPSPSQTPRSVSLTPYSQLVIGCPE